MERRWAEEIVPERASKSVTTRGNQAHPQFGNVSWRAFSGINGGYEQGRSFAFVLGEFA